jgi:iron complex transport system ATP-binding protein
VSLHIENLSAGYRDGLVLHELTLHVREGVICAVMGRNGSGKTTLLRCINGVLKPTQGIARAFGKDVARLSRMEVARLISLVPQSSPSAFPFSSVEMILMASASRIQPWSAPCQKEVAAAMEVLREVGIEHLARRPFNHLSGGERQLVMLSRALFQNAPIMLLDEPNSHLDFSNQHRMMEMMCAVVKKRGVTAVISLHDPNLTLQYCDRVVMLKKGRLIADGPTGTVMNEATLREVLGENIQTDVTRGGLRVVTPRAARAGPGADAGRTAGADGGERPAERPMSDGDSTGGGTDAMRLL